MTDMKTTADRMAILFQERIAAIFDQVIAAHDPARGEKRIFEGLGRWYASVELKSLELGIGVYLPLMDDFELYVVSFRGPVDFSDPVVVHSKTEHKALYVSTNTFDVKHDDFDVWLREQIDRALEIAKRRPQDNSRE